MRVQKKQKNVAMTHADIACLFVNFIKYEVFYHMNVFGLD